MSIQVHPWSDGLWVVTVDGQIASSPVPRYRAEEIAGFASGVLDDSDILEEEVEVSDACLEDFIPAPSVVDANQTCMKWAPPTHGGKEDFIPTPARVTEALLAHFPPPEGTVLEPCAGGGAIVRVLALHGYNVDAVEIREAEREHLREAGAQTVSTADWFDVMVSWPRRYPIVTNPPYGRLPSIAQSMMGRPYTALLLPIEEICGVARAKEYLVPTGMVSISWRPFPHVRGVAWFVWEAGKTPLDIRVV